MKKETLDRISKEQLEIEYIVRKKSFRDLGKEYGFNNRTIKKLLDYYGIKIRYGSEAVKSQWQGEKGNNRREESYKNRKEKIYDKDGYVLINYKGEHKGKDKGRIREHIYVMEQHLGRLLEEGEVVHHIDHDKTNNNINNLELMTASDHAKLHYIERDIDDNGRLLEDMNQEDVKKKNPFKEIIS